eukprot:5724608-Amphidinium_carterae.1
MSACGTSSLPFHDLHCVQNLRKVCRLSSRVTSAWGSRVHCCQINTQFTTGGQTYTVQVAE